MISSQKSKPIIWRVGKSAPKAGLSAKNSLPDANFFTDHQALYRKIVECNYPHHRQVYAGLHRFILRNFRGSFRFVDLGCGDAASSAKALSRTKAAHYTAVDISKPALALARKNMDSVVLKKRFIQEDFFEYIKHKQNHAHLVWIGLSLHHLTLAQKDYLFERCSKILKPKGFLVVFDPMLKEKETREEFLKRWWSWCQRKWKRMTPKEKKSIHTHANCSDFPETVSTLKAIAIRNGFKVVRSLFADHDQLYQSIIFGR